MKTSLISSLSIVSLCAAACGDAQATPDYRGESLLHVSGSIQTTPGVELGADVTPVLLWELGDYKDDFTRVQVQEAQVRGDFPTKFELDLYEPPPAEVPAGLDFVPAKGLENEPLITVGFLGALPAEHEDTVVLGYEQNPEEDECALYDAEEKPVCKQTYCDYYEQCWSEWHDQTQEDWPVVKATNTLAVRNGLGILSGFVSGYLVLYFDRPAAEGSLSAYRFGAQSLEEGYHLVRVSEVAGEPGEDETSDACSEQAAEAARKRFEEAYGLTIEELDESDDAEDDPRYGAFYTYEEYAAMELGCSKPGEYDGVRFELVDADEAVTMQLGAELNGF